MFHGRCNIIKAIANEPTRTLQGDPKLQVYRTVWKQYFTAIPCDDGKIDIETLDAHLAHAKRSGWTVLVTFDDLLAAQRNPKVTDLFVSGRHSGIDTATLCQTLKTGNRTARINASVFWCFNMSGKRCFAELADLLTTEKRRSKLLVALERQEYVVYNDQLRPYYKPTGPAGKRPDE